MGRTDLNLMEIVRGVCYGVALGAEVGSLHISFRHILSFNSLVKHSGHGWFGGYRSDFTNSTLLIPTAVMLYLSSRR
jgi:hypothetical protein